MVCGRDMGLRMQERCMQAVVHTSTVAKLNLKLAERNQSRASTSAPPLIPTAQTPTSLCFDDISSRRYCHHTYSDTSRQVDGPLPLVLLPSRVIRCIRISEENSCPQHSTQLTSRAWTVNSTSWRRMESSVCPISVAHPVSTHSRVPGRPHPHPRAPGR